MKQYHLDGQPSSAPMTVSAFPFLEKAWFWASFSMGVRQGQMQSLVAVRLVFSSFLLLMAFSLQAQSITGRVFRDFNANGTVDANEAGVGGVIVSAYDANDPLGTPTATTTTNSSGPSLGSVGTYVLTGLTAATVYRLEFTWPTAGVGNMSFLQPGAAGGTSVQFATAGDTNVNLGISPDGQYCPPVGDIDIITTCAVTGNPFAPGNNLANDGILISVDYTASGTTPPATYLATASQVGGYLHGLAKDPLSNRVFSANTLKRHASFGPDRNNLSSDGEGGAVYVTNLSGALPNANIYIDLVNDLGIDVGQALIPNNVARGLPANKGNASLDVAAFAQIGKMGIGDIEISDDGANLFVVNLFDRRVYQILTADVDNGAPYSHTIIPDFPNYSGGCANGVQRPYGLSYHDGDLYLGVVCTGESNTTTNTNADLVAFVYRYDLNNSSGGGWSTAITFPLTYPKGYAFYNEAGTNQWYNWTDVFSYVNPLSEGSMQSGGTFGGNMFRPQPILSDIEFDEDGSMILGFMDRTGHQLGHRNAWPTNINQLTTAVTGGDILRTYLNPATGTFVLENAGAAGPYTSSGTGAGQQGPGGPTSNQGPGGGEFFWRDYGNNAFNVTAHSEISNGGLAICLGTREVVLSAYDPLDELDSGGYIVLDDNNGSKVRGYRLYQDDGFPPASGTSGKGNGVGDIEFRIAPTPIEVGNYVWSDTDQDGVQDPGENGISGLTLQLWADTDNNGSVDTKVAETTTDANGRYLFSKTGTNAFGRPENWTFYGGDNDKVEPNRAYEIRVATAQGALTGFSLTGQNTAASGAVTTNNNRTDLRDSDGALSGGNAVIAFTTGGQGENNHTLDLGFSMPTCSITLTTTASDCYDSNGSAAGGSSVIDIVVTVGFSGLASGVSINVSVPGATPAMQTITPMPAQTQGTLVFTVPANGTAYTITATSSDAVCTNSTGYNAPNSTCIMDVIDCENCLFYVSSTDNGLHRVSQAGPVLAPDPFQVGPVSGTAPATLQAEAIVFYDNNSKYFRSYWTTGYNTYMEFFDANTHTLLSFYTIPAPMLDAVMHPDGDKFYATFRDQVRLINLATGATIYTASTPDSWGLDINPLTGEVFVANGWTGFAGVLTDGIVQRFSATLVNLGTVVPHNNTGFSGLKFLPDGTFYVANAFPTNTAIQDVRHYQANGTLIRTIPIPLSKQTGSLWDVDTAIDGNIYIVGAGASCIIKINVAEDRFEGVLTQVAQSATGKNLASACVCPVLNNLQTPSATTICAGETITQFSATSNSAAIKFVLFNSLPADPYTASGTLLGTVTGSTASVGTRTLTGSFPFNIPGTYYVYALLDDLCGLDALCRPSGQLQITVTAPATVTAGGPDNVCQSATPTAITLSGASVGGGATTGAWSIITGGGTLSSTAQTATPGTLTYTPAANYTGTVTLRLTTNDPAGTCNPVTADRTITVDPLATVNAGGPNNLCQSATPTAITLSGAGIGGGATTGAWSIITGGGTLSSTAQTGSPASVTYTPAANYTGTVTLRLTTDDPAGPCDPVSADRTITIDPAATVNAGGPDIVCQSATPSAITLSGASVGGAATTGAWSIITGGGTLSSTAQTANPETVTYTPAANFTGTVTLRLTTDDPTGACGPVTADRTITVNPAPDLPAGPLALTNVCPAIRADLTSLTAPDANNAAGTVTYHSTLNGASNPANNTTDVVPNPASVAVPGTYYIRKTTATGCFDYVAVTVTATNCCVLVPCGTTTVTKN